MAAPESEPPGQKQPPHDTKPTAAHGTCHLLHSPGVGSRSNMGHSRQIPLENSSVSKKIRPLAMEMTLVGCKQTRHQPASVTGDAVKEPPPKDPLLWLLAPPSVGGCRMRIQDRPLARPGGAAVAGRVFADGQSLLHGSETFSCRARVGATRLSGAASEAAASPTVAHVTASASEPPHQLGSVGGSVVPHSCSFPPPHR